MSSLIIFQDAYPWDVVDREPTDMGNTSEQRKPSRSSGKCVLTPSVRPAFEHAIKTAQARGSVAFARTIRATCLCLKRKFKLLGCAERSQVEIGVLIEFFPMLRSGRESPWYFVSLSSSLVPSRPSRVNSTYSQFSIVTYEKLC